MELSHGCHLGFEISFAKSDLLHTSEKSDLAELGGFHIKMAALALLYSLYTQDKTKLIIGGNHG